MQDEHLEAFSGYQYGWYDSDTAGVAVQRGLSEAVARHIPELKGEPKWMRNLRLRALRLFGKKPTPAWDTELDEIDFDSIKYFVRSTERQVQTWDDLSEDIKNIYGRPGIPEAEKAHPVTGAATRCEPGVVYHNINQKLERQGAIFLDTDTIPKEHPEIFEEHFASIVPAGDNKSAALNIAVWSGESFVYVPKGIHVSVPLQAYFRINTENIGQFGRILIIINEDAYIHYVESYAVSIYSSDSLRSAMVEIIIKKGVRYRYATIQNWSNNIYNLVAKRVAYREGATMEWVDDNIGSKAIMEYPAVYLMDKHVRGETLPIALAGGGQHQDTGSKMVHCAPHTSSSIISESAARGNGHASYRDPVKVDTGAHHSASSVKCDVLLMDTVSHSDIYPYVDVREDDVSMAHEATVSKISDDQLFYPMSRGTEEDKVMAMIMCSFVEPIAKELPMEYALELNRPIELQMGGTVG